MKIGLIGCGKQAPKHISGLLADKRVETIFVTDSNTERAQTIAQKSGPRVKRLDNTAMMARPDIDGLIITTPTPSHFALCQQAILSGRPFLVEKPFVASYQQAKTLLELAQTHKVSAQIGFIYRFSPIFAHFKTYLADRGSSSLGAPRKAVFEIGGRGSHAAWKHQKIHQGGVIAEMIVHMLDLAIWFFGPVKDARILEVDCIQKIRNINGKTVDCDAEDWCVVELVMANGTEVLIQSDSISPTFHQWADIKTAHGRLQGSIEDTERNALMLCKDTPQIHPLRFEPTNLYIYQARSFLDRIAGQLSSRAQVFDVCTLEEGVENMRVMAHLQNQIEHDKANRALL